MTQDHENMIAALAAATERDREPTAGCPDGRSKWHTAGRLMDEEGFDPGGVTAVHRLAGHLVRKGLAATRTTLGVTRWALTESGTGYARHLARALPPAETPAPRGRADRRMLVRSGS
jgi:hypothetical protein